MLKQSERHLQVQETTSSPCSTGGFAVRQGVWSESSGRAGALLVFTNQNSRYNQRSFISRKSRGAVMGPQHGNVQPGSKARSSILWLCLDGCLVDRKGMDAPVIKHATVRSTRALAECQIFTKSSPQKPKNTNLIARFKPAAQHPTSSLPLRTWRGLTEGSCSFFTALSVFVGAGNGPS